MALIFGSKTTRANAGVGNTTTVGPYTVHQFTTSTNFTPAVTGFVDILLVGGGGAGGPGSGDGGGGGGAGATLFKKMIPVTASTPYPISIGPGGPSGPPNAPGTPTTFIYSGITITASGGGRGGPDSVPGAGANVPTASGGGCGQYGPNASTFPSPGGTGAGVLGIGFPGGASGYGSPYKGGGGGGAGGAGAAGNPGGYGGGVGGAGVPITYFTGISTDIASVGGPSGGNALTGITSTSYGSGGCCGTGANPAGPGGRPGVAYIRYI